MSARVVFRSVVLLAMIVAGVAAAETAQQVPIGPRALALGGAYTSLVVDASATFWNPAGLARIEHQEMAFTHANLFKTGIRDNFSALAIPFAANRAAAFSWTDSGYDDGELAFGENQVDLSAGVLMSEWLQLGATGKLVTRDVGLDGVTVRQGQGLGLDLGALLVPAERFRLGLVVQDLLGTRVRDADGISEVIFPRAVRARFDAGPPRHRELRSGRSLASRARGHAAAGAGAEVRRPGRPARRRAADLELRARPARRTVRLDWARVEHPVLESTDHLAVSLEFNSARRR